MTRTASSRRVDSSRRLVTGAMVRRCYRKTGGYRGMYWSVLGATPDQQNSGPRTAGRPERMERAVRGRNECFQSGNSHVAELPRGRSRWMIELVLDAQYIPERLRRTTTSVLSATVMLLPRPGSSSLAPRILRSRTRLRWARQYSNKSVPSYPTKVRGQAAARCRIQRVKGSTPFL